MNGKNIKYFLGIDGGGTKTEFLLTDSAGKEIERLHLGGSNPVSTGIKNTCVILDEGIRQIFSNEFDIAKTAVYAGIAGGKTGENQKLINDFFSKFGFASFDCGSDVDLAIEITLNGENGTSVIMGTGIVAYSRSDGNLNRAGGRGYLIDRGGSGFHFGADALNSAFEFIDGRGGSETILKLVENKLSKSLETSTSEIYNGGVSYIASFAPVVFEAYNLGDSTAFEIIDRNAFEAAKIINGARKKMTSFDNKIVICGGLCKQKETLYPFLMKYIEGEATLTFLDEPMVNGAVLLAERSVKLC